MAIVSQMPTGNDREVMVIPNLPMLQARLAKDGTDDDIKVAFTDVADKTARLKALVRKGIEAEQGGVVTENSDFIFDGHDLALTEEVIVAQIGSHRQVIRR